MWAAIVAVCVVAVVFVVSVSTVSAIASIFAVFSILAISVCVAVCLLSEVNAVYHDGYIVELLLSSELVDVGDGVLWSVVGAADAECCIC